MKLLRGGVDSWQIHLSAAASLVPTMISHLTPHACLSQYPNWSSTSALDRFKHANTSTAPDERPPVGDDIACDFFVGTFIWFDIISCASNNSSPYLPASYKYLESHNIQLHKVMGCENMVMILIAQISELSTWKTSQQGAERLSTEELISRGAEIERKLHCALEDINRRTNSPDVYSEASPGQKIGIPPSNLNLLITRIFAFSALTYLYCTISSANPSVPKLHSSVTSSIEVFKELKDASMLRNLVLPFCITGCMASKEQEDFFRERMLWLGKEEGFSGFSGNLRKGWDVIRECWRLRAEGEEVNWVRAMESLGFQVLLV
jgi:hypothetical protein